MKSIIESLLVTHLGKYVDGLKNSLDIGLLDGEVTIQKVSLKSSFFNQLGLPFTLKFSHIEKIHIDIPWTSLKTKNTIITVRGIYALLSINYEERTEQIDPQQIMKEMLQRIKLQMKKKWTEGVKDQTFAQKNLIRIIDNAVLNINNIHLRIQSFKRNWDYSIGVIMDDVNSYTVDQYDQKTFYQRSFSKKQTNKPLNKILNIQTFKVYFNDEQKVFLCNLLQQGHAFSLKAMAYPFTGKEKRTALSSPSKGKSQSQEDTRPVPHYDLKNLAVISLMATGTQSFAQDMRYNVNLRVHMNKIDISLGDLQLSKLLFMVQHFYQYSLNLDKNGKKTFVFEEHMKKVFRNLIAKIAREQKLTIQERSQLLLLIKNVPTSILQDDVDEVINDVRVQIQMKKIAKVSNAQKSKKMLQELMQKQQKLSAMEGVQLFKQIVIQAQIDTIMFSMQNKNEQFAQLGFLGTQISSVMDLNGLIKISVKFFNAVLRYKGTEITQDLYDLTLPWLHLYFQILKNDIKKMHIALQKKELIFNQQSLCSLIDWISLIRIRPSLLNYMQQLINYSIDITRVMMQFMFAKGRQIHWSLALPLATLQIDANTFLKINFGHFLGQNSEENDKFYNQYLEGIQILSNDQKLFQIDQGTMITFVDAIKDTTTYEQVQISVPKMQIQNIEEVLRLIYAVRKSHTFSIIIRYDSLDLIDHSLDEQLEGQFYLNKIKTKLNMKLAKTQLVFIPVDKQLPFQPQSISLVRTKIFKLVNNNRYFIVFKEQVDRLVNIVEACSAKTMQTIFIKLKDYIYEISTSFQWHKYHVKPYNAEISTLEEIQDINLKNDVLMTLSVNFQVISIEFSQNSYLNLCKTKGDISYNQFNTEAAIQLKKVDLVVDNEKIIYDASFKGRYQYLQSMLIQLEVLKLGFQVKLHKTFSRIIAIASEYELLIYSLRAKNPKKMIPIQQDQNRLQGIKTQSNRTDNLNKFLLQRKFVVQSSNIQGDILGYTNKLSYIRVQTMKFRNELQHHIQAQTKGIVLLSMIELPLITFKYTSTQFYLLVDSINAEIDLSILIFQVIKGQGSLILQEVIKAYRNKQIAIKETKDQKSRKQASLAFKNQLLKRNFILKVDFLRIQLNISGNLCIGFLSKEVQLQVGRLSWTGLIFQLNKQCVSTTYSNAIMKWSPTTLDFFMTNLKLKLNSKQVIFLFNEIYKIYVYLKSKQFDLIKFIKAQISKPDEKGRQLQQVTRAVNLRIQEIQLIYECADRNPLISIRLKPIFLTTDGQINTLNLSVWHLNRKLKLYQPVIEPFQIKMVEKNETHQIDFLFENLYIVVTQEFVVDVIQEIKLLKQIKKEIQKDENNELQQLNRDEVDQIKKALFSYHFKGYDNLDFQEVTQYSFVLKITSHLSCKALVQMRCGRTQKKQLLYQNQNLNNGQTKILSIAQKTSYSFSYQLIERYQKIMLKICLVNQFYAIKNISISFLLYDRDNYYIHPVTVVDSNGIEKQTNLALKVQYSQGVYLIDVMAMYSIKNQTDLELCFRYSDNFSINKFKLAKNQKLTLPLWVVDSVNFGIEENDLCHLMRLRPEEGSQSPGFHLLSIRKEHNYKANVIIHKEVRENKKMETPELRLVQKKLQQNDAEQHPQLKQPKKEAQQSSQRQSQQTTPAAIPRVYTFRIIPAILIRNHFRFPLIINSQLFQPEQQRELLFIYQDKQKQYIKLSLGDNSLHQIYLGDIDEVTNVNLKLTDQNYVVVYLMVRKNKMQQKIVHIYCEVQLMINIPNMLTPVLKTNIYNYIFIMKKQVKNNCTDLIHPAPILKDKFVFNTFHYLLSLQEKYVTVELNNLKSNQIILYHSDFDKDLKFKNDQGEDEYIFAVSYETKVIELENDIQGRKPQFLECHFTYIMPKYYLINRAEEVLVVDGSLMVRAGQKIALNKPKNLSLNIRDRLQFEHVSKSFDQSTYLMFIRSKEPSIKEGLEGVSSALEDLERRERAESYAKYHSHGRRLEEISETSQLELASSKREELDFEEISDLSHEQGALRKLSQSMKQIQLQFQQDEDKIRQQQQSPQLHKQAQSSPSRHQPQQGHSPKRSHSPKRTRPKQIQPTTSQQQSVQAQQQQSHSLGPFDNINNRLNMSDVIIFALSKRICDYNTVSYEVHQWHQWLEVKNQLICPIILRVKINQNTLGEEVIASGQTGKIIAGLSELLEIAVFYRNQEILLGHYSLTQRLNHNIFLNNYESLQIILKQYKVKIGRFMAIQSSKNQKDKNIYKAINSINLIINKITVSLILHQQKIRRQLIRFNINNPRFMFLHYKNGLYMCHLKIQLIHGIFKRMMFLALGDFEGYLQGLKGQFIERLSVSIKDTLSIVLTDDLIASMMNQFQIFQKYLPKSQLFQQEQQILQEQQTYHINSLGINSIQIKLCIRKIISQMNETQSKLFQNLSLSLIEIQDAIINLSAVQINTPLKQKHINGISKMYTMEGFVGVASGLNILGNPAQFMSQFQAGRNRGGVLPFFRSITAGISNSLSKIIGTIGSGFSQLTFDKEFMRNRIRDRNNKADSFGSGLKIGLKQFAYSIKSSITGLVQQPIQGHHQQGGIGIIKGTLFGLTGLVTKPVTGLILAISKTIQGINSSITYLDYTNLLSRDLIMRPLYHKFKMVRPYKSEDELAYNILLNWYNYTQVQLVGSYLLQSQQEDALADLLIVTCSQLILIDLNAKDIVAKLKMDQLLATGKFMGGVVLYYHSQNGDDSQDQLVFGVNDHSAKENLYHTLKSFIYLYTQS